MDQNRTRYKSLRTKIGFKPTIYNVNMDDTFSIGFLKKYNKAPKYLHRKEQFWKKEKPTSSQCEITKIPLGHTRVKKWLKIILYPV